MLPLQQVQNCTDAVGLIFTSKETHFAKHESLAIIKDSWETIADTYPPHFQDLFHCQISSRNSST